MNGSYVSGLAPVATDEEGELVSVDRYQTYGFIGAYGTRKWRHSSLGLDYRGGYQYGNNRRAPRGVNQALSLSYDHQMSRRVSISLGQSAGMSNRAYGFYHTGAAFGNELIGVPDDEIFDNRIYFSQSTAAAGYQFSARTAAAINGSFFLVRRKRGVLAGLNGYRASARMVHRLSFRDTISGGYQFMNFHFPGLFGSSHIHGVQAEYQRMLSPRLILSFLGGVYRSESLGRRTVTLDPEVAEILGQRTALEAAHNVNYLPQGSVELAYLRQFSRVNINYRRGVTPGNGLFLTSQRESINVGYSYSGIQKISLGADVGYFRSTALFRERGRWNTVRGSIGASYLIGRHVNLTTSLFARKFYLPNDLKRTSYGVTFGLAVSPIAVPLSIW
ncbi:MAG: hypothetical protein ACRD7E_23755 [Bryobacteraceae bacterium]